MRSALCRFWVWLMLRWGLYYRWSKVYQAVVERPWRRCGPLPKYEAMTELERFLGTLEWREDGLLTLGDAIGSPKSTYWRWRLQHDDHGWLGADCDEFALYAADRIKDMALRGVLAGDGVHYADVYLLTVTWMSKGKPAGHNVCAFRYVGANGVPLWAHVGNWNGGSRVGGFAQIEDVVENILVGGGADECIGWATATPGLKNVHYDNGKGMI